MARPRGLATHAGSPHIDTTAPPPRTPEAFAPANGLRICYDTIGDPAAPPILLIMGLGNQMTLWEDEFCVRLAACGFHVIRFDNRDVGRSSSIDTAVKVDLASLLMARQQGQPVIAPYVLRDMADDAAGLLDALGIAAAHVVGVSMGGMIAQELAVHHPARVLSLVSIMSTTGTADVPGPTPEAASVLMAPPARTREDYVAQYCLGWKIMRAGSFPVDEARDPIRAAAFYDRGLNPAGTARQLLAIFASGDRTVSLAAVRAPTLVIHGEADPLVHIDAGRATQAAIPGARMLAVPGMGHALPMVFWPTVIEAIAETGRLGGAKPPPPNPPALL